mgnify:CR=1 FL=1
MADDAFGRMVLDFHRGDLAERPAIAATTTI